MARAPRQRPGLRLFAGTVVIAAGVAVFAWSLRSGPEPVAAPAANALSVVSRVPVGTQDSGLLGPIPQLELPEHNSRGRTLQVKGDHPTSGSGKPGDPWNDLQQALCRLQPGDRLLIWPGNYATPIAIDGDCIDGTPERPIEVVAAAGARIIGPDIREPMDRPAMRVARSHWHFYNLEIEPQWTRPGVRLAPAVADIRLVGLHILKGIGSGVEISHGASEITISGGHLHHLGTLRGTRRDFRDPNTAGVVVAPGTSGIVISLTDIHHMEGAAVRVFDPDEYLQAPGLPAADGVVVEGVTSRALLGEWD